MTKRDWNAIGKPSTQFQLLGWWLASQPNDANSQAHRALSQPISLHRIHFDAGICLQRCARHTKYEGELNKN